MPLFWTYLLKKYFRVFTLSTFGFITILMSAKLKDIAQFSVLSSSLKNTLLFALLQTPHILSIALPISSLIASFTLFRHLTLSSEITALRCFKMSLLPIYAPIFIASFFLFLSHFYICSELTTYSKHKSREMVLKSTTENPLLLLKRQKLLRLPKSYIDFTLSSDGKRAQNMTLIFKNPDTKGLLLVSAKKMLLKKQNLIGEKCSFLSTFKPTKEGFDKIILENQETITSYAPEISSFMKKSKERMNATSLPLRILLLYSEKTEKMASFLKELTRRFSLAFSVISFTFVGFCFSLSLSRFVSFKKLFQLSLLVLFFFLSYFLAKGWKVSFFFSISLFILPHFILFFFGAFSLLKIRRGIE